MCSCFSLSLLGFWHQASSIQLKPALTGVHPHGQHSLPVSLYLLVIPACLFPALAIPRPTEVCVRGARVQRGDQRTEPRRLSGVSSRPAKVGAAGTRLALWNAGTLWTRLLAFPKSGCDPAGNGFLAGHVALPSQQTRLSLLFTPGLPSCGPTASSGSSAENFFF